MSKSKSKSKTKNKTKQKSRVNKFTKKNNKKRSIAPFSGKIYQITSPNCTHVDNCCIYNKWQYAFNSNGTAYNLNIVKDGNTFTAVPNIEIVQSNIDKYLYFSPMIFPKNNKLIVRYVQTGMKFNKNYTSIDTGYKIGGPFFQFALDNEVGKNFYKGYSKNKQELMKKNFESGQLLFAPDSYPTIFKVI